MNNFDDDFWNETKETTGTTNDAGGSFEPIPDGTRCIASIEAIQFKPYDQSAGFDQSGLEYVESTWVIEKPEEYANRKVFQKIKIYGDDPSSQYYKPEKHQSILKRAREMFFAIDKNCGSNIANLKRKPTNEEMQKFLSWKKMLVTLGIWEINGKSGNFIRKLEPISSTSTVAKTVSDQKMSIEDDADVPF